MELLRIQRALETLYEIELPVSVSDFLVTDRTVVNELDGEHGFESDEKLLIRSSTDTVEMTLFIDQAVMDRISNDDPSRCLHDGNLSDYLLLVEGVSHFVYAAWNARYDKPITLMELELQGEVDKYVQAGVTIMKQTHGVFPGGLRSSLFERFSLQAELDHAARRRYRDASNYAHRYCRHLETRFRRSRGRSRTDRHSLTTDLRRFYRMNQAAKIRAIRAATA